VSSRPPVREMQPTWAFVEVGHPWTESWTATITPDQMEGATWGAIISGARGIVLFNHNLGGSRISSHVLLECGTAMRDRVTSVAARIRSLAPVLNSPTYQWADAPGLSTMLKKSNGSWYLFSQVSQTGTTGSKTMTLPNRVSGTVEVV